MLGFLLASLLATIRTCLTRGGSHNVIGFLRWREACVVPPIWIGRQGLNGLV